MATTFEEDMNYLQTILPIIPLELKQFISVIKLHMNHQNKPLNEIFYLNFPDRIMNEILDDMYSNIQAGEMGNPTGKKTQKKEEDYIAFYGLDGTELTAVFSTDKLFPELVKWKLHPPLRVENPLLCDVHVFDSFIEMYEFYLVNHLNYVHNPERYLPEFDFILEKTGLERVSYEGTFICTKEGSNA